jgi:hypothetical protein
MVRILSFLAFVGAANAQRCSTSALQVGNMNSACCNGGHRRRTQSGPCFLTTCSASCAQLFVPFYTQCSQTPGSQLGMIPNADRFFAACVAAQGAVPPPPPTPVGGCTNDRDCSPTQFCRANDNNFPPRSSSCVAKSAAGAHCGGMMPPSMQTRCMDGLQCVNDNGMMAMDGGGHCHPPCARGSQRDSWGNCVPATCQTWFDGCSECHVVGGRFTCAQPATGPCHSRNQNGAAGCHDSTAPPTGGGAGVCTQSSAMNPTCSRMLCPNRAATTQAACMAGPFGQCCSWSAAAPPPPPAHAGCTSSLSCEALTAAYDGWPVATGAAGVCGESDNGFAVVSFGGLHQHTGMTMCYGADDTQTDGWQHAQAICFEIGARLCSQQELTAGAGLNTGCGHNAAPIWVQESCTTPTGPGHMTVNPSTRAATCSTNTPTTLPAVRCCADTAASKTTSDITNGHCDAFTHGTGCTSPRSCNELTAVSGTGSWPTQHGDVMVCGESDNGLGPNHTAHCYGASGATGADVIGWSQAHTICANAGARMCTIDELEADETQGTGCLHDRAMVWTGEVGHCAAGEHMTVIGAGGGSTGHRRRNCVVDTGSAAVRCCADAITSLATACGTTTTGAPPSPPSGSSTTIYVINSSGQCGQATFPTAWRSQAFGWASTQGVTARLGTCASAGFTHL